MLQWTIDSAKVAYCADWRCRSEVGLRLRLLSVLLFAISLSPLYAQEPEGTPQDDQLLEDIVAGTEQTFDFDTYQAYLGELAQDPINLNTASTAALAELRLLSRQQIESLQRYIRRYGALVTLYELQAVPLFDRAIIDRIAPYITVTSNTAPPPQPKKIWAYNRQQLFMRYQRVLEPQLGYMLPDTADRQRYLGRPERLYLRYQFRYRRQISTGFTLEKDPGEPLWDTLYKRPDFASAHLYVQDVGRWKAIALGDYAINFGQGLVVWSGFGFNKSPSPMQVKRNSFAVRPYTSVNEALYFRGGALSYQLTPRISATAFASHKKRDASIQPVDTLDDNAIVARTLQVSGYHRTPQEWRNRKSVLEQVAGGELKYEGRYVDIGVTAAHTRLDTDLNPMVRPYSQFRFAGNALTNVGIHYTGLYRNALLFGETAHSLGNGWATINGLTYNLDHKTALSMVFRHYDKDYQSLYSQAFGESATTENETGFYLGVQTAVAPKLTLAGFIDFYRHPWLRFRADAPSHGVEYLGQLTYNLGWGSSVYLRGRHEVKWQNKANQEAAMDFLVPAARTAIRLHFAKDVSRRITIRSRAEFTQFKEDDTAPEEGFLLYQDIQYQLRKLPVNIQSRFALFSTDGFNARLYAYESDVLYSFSIPAYQGEGSRWYVLVKWSPAEWLDAWVRIAQFTYPDAQEVGSGLNQIEGNRQTELKMQIRLRW